MAETIKSDYKIKNGMKAVWRLAFPHRKTIYFLIGIGTLSAIASAFTPYLSGRFFDALNLAAKVGPSGTIVPVFYALGLWFFAQIILNIVGWIQAFNSRGLPEDIEISINQINYHHLLRLPLSYHKEHHQSEIREICHRAAGRVPSIVNQSLSIFPDLLSVFFGIAIAFTLNVKLAFVLLSGALIYVVMMLRNVQTTASIHKEGVAAYGKAYGRAGSAVSQINIVKISTSEEYEDERRTKEFTEARGIWRRLESVWARLDGFQRTMVFVVQGTTFVLSVGLVVNGEITIGTLMAFNGYSAMFLSPIVRIGVQWQGFQAGFAAAALLYETVLDQPEELYAPKNAIPLGDIRGEVAFENVSFQYASDDALILDTVSFVAKQGETVALVGESGVGKSTTISLISGLYFPTSGSIKIDGKDTHELDLKELRSHIAVVPQELSLFNDTIEENIKYGTFDATHEQVVSAAKISQADQFIEKFTNGYETKVGERGVKLSVGQKQRVAIARAVLRNPAILILDEPTSALDSKTEKELSLSLEELMRGRTTFIVAHRLSTVRKADKILVVEEGKVIESGSHEDLMKIQNGKYRAMYEHYIGLEE
ncbi:MAG: ABC transporter ATP-binding protein [Candidatus Parcubacteria bacterium]|nr:ABC transporter ATP-binding protein [Candidatus Parcubacteria bacterium]